MLFKETAAVRLLGLRIPALLFVAPHVIELDDEGAAVGIPLGWRTRNHVGSMYVGVLAAGADLASGMNAFALIRARHPRVVPVFKYARMEFRKRADGDVVFRTRDGRRIAEAVATTERTGERVTRLRLTTRSGPRGSSRSSRHGWPRGSTSRSRSCAGAWRSMRSRCASLPWLRKCCSRTR